MFPRARVAIFVDGDFWHGRDWEKRQEALARGHNSDYWIKKIGSNMARDLRHSAALKNQGWSVLRIWEKDVLRDVEGAADAIVELLGSQKPRSEDRVQPTQTI